MSSINNDNWLDDPIIKEWLNKIHTERTVKNYKHEFPYFLEYVRANTPYKTPTEIAESRIKQRKSDNNAEKRFWEDTVINYMHYLEDKEFRASSIASYLTAPLSFFSHGTHEKLVYARNELIGGIRPKGKGKGRALSKEWIPDKTDMKTTYQISESKRDRAITLLLYQSGISEVDVTIAMIEDFDFFDASGNWIVDTNQHLYWSNERSKSREIFQTMISSECLEEIRLYL